MNNDLNNREQLSALVDGESSSLHMQAVLSFAESDEGQQSWGMYHLIGDVLRSPELAHHSQHDILSGVRAHMERDPIQGIHLPGLTADAAHTLAQGQLGPVAVAGKSESQGGNGVSLPARQAANASVFRWKMAAGFASVAAVAAVGWGVMVGGAGGFSGAQGTRQLVGMQPGTVVASAEMAAPKAFFSAAAPLPAAEESEMPLGHEAQSSAVVAVAGSSAQSMMLRDPRLDELLAAHPQYNSAANLQMPASFLRNASFATATRH